MIKLISNLSTGALLLTWLVVAQAQEKIGAQFGDQFLEISWKAWALVVFYGLIGALIRLKEAIKRREITPSFGEVAAWIALGVISGALTFGLCEALNSWTGIRLNDFVQGGLILAGAYSHEKVVDTFSARWQKMFGENKEAT